MFQAGLILEGGGMRGAYTAGVLDAFLDGNIHFKSIYGVSAGACHACSYISKQKGRAAKTVIDYAKDKNYMSFYSLLKTGDFFGVDMVYNQVPNKLLPFDYDTFYASDSKLHVVVTNCRKGKAEYKLMDSPQDGMQFIQASSSLPLLSRMVVLNGEEYLDGGISDSIPIKKAIEDGNQKNVVILTQFKGYRKGPNNLLPLLKLKYKHYPEFVNLLANRHIRYNQTLDFLSGKEKEGSIYVIRPQDPVKIGRLERDKDKLRNLYKIGYDDGVKSLDEVKSFLS